METIDFRFDWLDGTGIQGQELAATYSALEIRVGASPVTRVLDHRARAVRDCIHVPLFPLAESLASNWWFLTAESRTPTDAERHEHRQRRCLQSRLRQLRPWKFRHPGYRAASDLPGHPHPVRSILIVKEERRKRTDYSARAESHPKENC